MSLFNAIFWYNELVSAWLFCIVCSWYIYIYISMLVLCCMPYMHLQSRRCRRASIALHAALRALLQFTRWNINAYTIICLAISVCVLCVELKLPVYYGDNIVLNWHKLFLQTLTSQRQINILETQNEKRVLFMNESNVNRMNFKCM